MQTKKKKALSMLLVLAMVFSLFTSMPLTASAAGEVCEIVDTDGIAVVAQYNDLTDALAAVQDGQTIRLLADIDYGSGITIIGKSITFDVNGYVLNVTVTST